MTVRYLNYMRMLQQQDQAAALVALIAVGILLGLAALEWLPSRVQNVARKIYFSWILLAFVGSIVYVWLKG